MDVSTLQRALEANRKLQISIRNELHRIGGEIHDNRTRAATCLQQLHSLPTPVVSSKPFRRRFFEHKGSRPEPNQDDVVQQRRFRAWTEPEQVALSELAKSGPPQLDFEHISEELAKQKIQRTAAECKIQFQRQQNTSNLKFSQAQLKQIEDMAASAIDWASIATKLISGTFRPTPFDCLKAYHSSRPSAKSTSWTESEDELLLKYLAAAGPQFVFGGKNALYTRLLELFPNKNKRSIVDRSNQSLLNPAFVNKEWTPEEERRLAIFMKIYNELPLASAHFARGHKSVVDKWQRSLNPEYSAKPFTKTEDEKLVKILRQTKTLGWVELSKNYFPNRHPQRLMNRWSELASDQDILDREQHRVKKAKTSG